MICLREAGGVSDAGLHDRNIVFGVKVIASSVQSGSFIRRSGCMDKIRIRHMFDRSRRATREFYSGCRLNSY